MFVGKTHAVMGKTGSEIRQTWIQIVVPLLPKQ